MIEQFKKEAFALTKALNAHLKGHSINLKISHAQILELLANASGFSSFQAVHAKLDESKFMRCPHCGALGTLEKAEETVFVEAGAFDGEGFELEADAPMYQCSQCKNGFTDYFATNEELHARDFEIYLYESEHAYSKDEGTYVDAVGTVAKAIELVEAEPELFHSAYAVGVKDSRDSTEPTIWIKGPGTAD